MKTLYYFYKSCFQIFCIDISDSEKVLIKVFSPRFLFKKEKHLPSLGAFFETAENIIYHYFDNASS